MHWFFKNKYITKLAKITRREQFTNKNTEQYKL